MQPIFHLSLPVRDLDEAVNFYVEVLGCQAARAKDRFADVWFFGMQLTLHERPEEVRVSAAGATRHFGVTLERHEFDDLVAQLGARGTAWLAPVTTDDAGLPTEQTKGKFADPSGNVIEVKTYQDVTAALEFSPHPYPAASARGN